MWTLGRADKQEPPLFIPPAFLCHRKGRPWLFKKKKNFFLLFCGFMVSGAPKTFHLKPLDSLVCANLCWYLSPCSTVFFKRSSWGSFKTKREQCFLRDVGAERWEDLVNWGRKTRTGQRSRPAKGQVRETQRTR